MTEFKIPFHSGMAVCRLPVKAELLAMRGGQALPDPGKAVLAALASPIGSPALAEVVRAKRVEKPDAAAVIVISDNTRPVPYAGESGILLPIIRTLLDGGVPAGRIMVLVATGTHRGLREQELRAMIDPAVFELGIEIVNHNCQETGKMRHLGRTARGTEIHIDSRYVEADIKILTGLVESHFMAGASGGRKSICPGLVGEAGTNIFHGPQMLEHPLATDLVLEGNPCHEEALEVARAAGTDFIVNVTLDSSLKVSGVFAGDLEEAHQAAVKQVKAHVGIPVEHVYDVVISHAGFVGINHYQVAKTGTAISRIIKPGGMAIIAADTTDTVHPVGALTYRTVIQLLKVVGPQQFMRLIKSESWEFIPEQWQVQMWCKLFGMIPMDNLYLYAPQFLAEHYAMVPGIDGSRFISGDNCTTAVAEFYEKALLHAAGRLGKPVETLSVAILQDGPYGIPLLN